MSHISKSDQHFINEAFNASLESPCQMRHGCVAVANGKIVGRGCNHYRSLSRDGIVQNTCTCHAEMAAIRNCLRTHSQDPRQHYLLQLKVAKDI
ncbi:MAG: hypothetical protein CMB96_06270 [Flavobacteriaceae bacterium]|nr:hypothetical protein [Flavobacteriaceae bacterium]